MGSQLDDFSSFGLGLESKSSSASNHQRYISASTEGIMNGLRLEVSCPLCTFRIPYNTACIETYPFPPKTTAIGMLGAAAGWSEALFLNNIKRIKYGVLIESPGEESKETAVYFKSYDRDGAEFEQPSPRPGGKPHRMTRSPIIKYFLRRPKWVLYFASDEPGLIESVYESLNDPKYPVTVSDSESLFYPERIDFARYFASVLPVKTRRLRTVFPKDSISGDLRVGDWIEDSRCLILPRQYLAPVDFTKEGRSRRAIYLNLVAFSGYELCLENDVEVYCFGEEQVCLF